MRKGVFVAGVAVLTVGVALFAYSFVATTDIQIPPDQGKYQGKEILAGVHAFGSATLTVRWSGAGATTVVHVFSCSESSCATGPVHELGNGTGASGAVAVGVVGGATYFVNSSGFPNVLNGTIGLIGMTPAGVLGIVLVVAGTGLFALSLRKGPAPAPTPPPAGGSDPPGG